MEQALTKISNSEMRSLGTSQKHILLSRQQSHVSLYVVPGPPRGSAHLWVQGWMHGPNAAWPNEARSQDSSGAPRPGQLRGAVSGTSWPEAARRGTKDEQDCVPGQVMGEFCHSLRSLSTNVLFSRFPGSCKLVFTMDTVRSDVG